MVGAWSRAMWWALKLVLCVGHASKKIVLSLARANVTGSQIGVLRKPLMKNDLLRDQLGATLRDPIFLFCVRHSSRKTCFGTGLGHAARIEIYFLRESFIKNHLFRCWHGPCGEAPYLYFAWSTYQKPAVSGPVWGYIAGPDIGVLRKEFINKQIVPGMAREGGWGEGVLKLVFGMKHSSKWPVLEKAWGQAGNWCSACRIHQKTFVSGLAWAMWPGIWCSV